MNWRAQPFGGTIRELFRFCAVGVSNAAISLGVDAVVLYAGTPSAVASALAFMTGAVNGYIFNRRWTFDALDSHRTRVRYLLVQLAGLGMTVGLTAFLKDVAGAPALLAYLVATGPVTLVMFTANRHWTFSERRIGADHPNFPAGTLSPTSPRSRGAQSTRARPAS